MKLTVKNFGPIHKAEVVVKPMTVFVGPSNTGKSYLAMLIYTIAKAAARMEYRGIVHPLLIKKNFYEKEEVEEIISNDKIFAKLATGVFVQFVDNLRVLWKNEAPRCFGEEWKNITERESSSASVVISDDRNRIVLDLLSTGEYEFPQINSLFTEIKEQVSSRFEEYQDKEEYFDYITLLPGLVMDQFYYLFNFRSETTQHSRFRGGFIFREMSIGVKTHYLPAVRGGLMQSHRILVSAIVDRAPTIGLTGAEIVPFTGVLADFLQKLLNISGDHPGFISRKRQSQDTGKISKLSQEIEQKIIHGKIKIEMSETRYPNFRYQFNDGNKDTKDIPLIYASSSVSELAPIILFIRYYLSPDDVFIVEEPEAHLHPEAQRIIAGVLVELVNAGVRVIVTTHSDVIQEQISNFIHADDIPDAKVLNKKAKGRTLSKEKTGIYSFKAPAKRGSRTTVKAIKFDEQMGILTQDHLDVSSDLYNETVDLLNAKEGDDNDNI